MSESVEGESEPTAESDVVDEESFRLEGGTVQTTLTDEKEDELILSAYQARNSEVFPKVLDLHVEDGAKIADVTYGKGVFWKEVDVGNYEVYASDLDPEKSPCGHSVDCRNLPYEDDSFDVVVLDPPYAEGFFRRNKDMLAGGDGSHSNFRDHYSNGEVVDTNGSKYHQAVLDLYCEAGIEAKRVLKEDGTLIVKVQDEVSANTQELTHIQITNFYEGELDMYSKDLFVVVRSNKPAVSGMNKQVHARKNHSFFMVYELDETPTNILHADD
ncbi:DNA methyltransferase [Halorussus ruber]|uniref:DNA methyltransferase n=1 Tax=Halorussus ruber TaxID=1126238 RepID=UPI001091A5FC|nr:class I SAM-dependent methyltransferase [Halorussus ruber]